MWLDAVSIERYRVHRKAQLAARLRASTAWQDNDLISAAMMARRGPGPGVTPLQGTLAEAGRAGNQIARGAALGGVPGPGRGVDPKIRKEQLGHTTQAMSDHYTHVLAEAHLEAAERVARLVAGETKETGS